MIKELTLDDNLKYLNLGLQLNSNFTKSFDLKNVYLYDYNKVYGYFIDNILVGFIHIQITVDEVDIVNIVVDKLNRKQGIGTKLINHIIEVTKCKAINLEVKETNNEAINFYQDLGFKTYRVIQNYYSDKTNAKFMKKVIDYE